jgi:hypothetical protein
LEIKKSINTLNIIKFEKMSLSHFKNSIPSVNQYEVVNPSLFEVTILPPNYEDGVTKIDGETTLLLEHVRSISGLDGLNPSIGVATQKFKQAERHYAGGPDSTHLELGITFSLNLNNYNENYIYTTLRKWNNLIYNPATGGMGLKAGYTGQMIIVEYNRDGSIWRKITCSQVFPTGQMTGLGDKSYDDPNAASELSITFMCDVWDEETVGLPIYN